jgi:hypothetical protein
MRRFLPYFQANICWFRQHFNLRPHPNIFCYVSTEYRGPSRKWILDLCCSCAVSSGGTLAVARTFLRSNANFEDGDEHPPGVGGLNRDETHSNMNLYIRTMG